MDPREETTRFLFDKREFNRTKNTVCGRAYLPRDPHVTGKYETSIFITTQSSREEIWEIGEKVSQLRAPNLKGKSKLIASFIFDVDLDIEAPTSKFGGKHSNIIKWPKTEEARLEIVAEMALHAVLSLPS